MFYRLDAFLVAKLTPSKHWLLDATKIQATHSKPTLLILL